MTGKELCEAYVRFKHPELEAQHVEHLALRLWEANPCGELHHLEEMRLEMIAGGALPSDPRPEHPVFGDTYVERNEDGSLTRRTFDGASWREIWRK